MSDLDEDLTRGRRAVADVRRDIWPAYGGLMPDEPTDTEVNRYIEALESKVAGTAMALGLAGRMLRS